MRPLAQSDGHDAPRLIGEFVPSLAAMIDDVVVGAEHAVGAPILAHELPDVLYRVQLRAFGWQRHDGDVGRHDELMRQVPSGLVDEKHGVSVRCDGRCDFGEVQAHRLGVAAGQHKSGPFAFPGADGAEDIGRGGPLVLWR